MEGAVTISKFPPELQSMDYETLRQLGLAKIQELAGKLWTDYNSHDPGVTMLEVFSYVLTDLGYRVNYDIKDILAQDLTNPDAYDIQNFYTACKILPNCPLTLNDYRKLLMDVELVEEKVFPGGASQTIHSGVKNAWIYCSDEAEHKIYIDYKRNELTLDEIKGIKQKGGPIGLKRSRQVDRSYYVKTLYDVLLEFNKNEWYGDLNETTLDGTFVLYEHAADPELVGLKVYVKVEFPRWDEADVDWEDVTSIQSKIKSVKVKITAPAGFTVDYVITNKFEVALTGTKTNSGGTANISGLATVVNLLNTFIYHPGNGLVAKYVERVYKVLEIIEEVKATLHANRNLCDDFYRFSALKVEEIILCTDLELAPEADVNQVEAEIFQAISKFLSPTVYFYTIDELLNKCRNFNQYPLLSASTNKQIISVTGPLQENFNAGDTLTIEGSDAWSGEYTLKCVKTRRDDPTILDIEVEEDLPADDLTGEEYLFRGTVDENLCLTVDQIFEGPKLKHGFIDEDELTLAERKKVIHVSDLIQIIMDVEGVIAVKSIQIANRPQDNDEGIASKSVKWCLELAFDYNYVPRLNTDDSVITYYKEQLPFLANDEEVAAILEELESEERSQKIYYPTLDIPVPRGSFKDLENYTSLQEDFPMVYGVGSAGIPGLSDLDKTAKNQRIAKANQLKGFLLFFDQLMANYLSQLHHVKDLFSMNGEKNKFGEYQIDKTYFSQTLNEIVPNAGPLYVDEAGHLVALRNIVEDEELYLQRRNKFLDHLLGRFSETFTDYALLLYRVEGARASADLIEDKLQFLSAYPELSAGRGKGMNYKSPCYLWHVDNRAGLERRASLLTGMEPLKNSELVFRPNFQVIDTGTDYTLEISNDAATLLLTGSAALDSEENALMAMELIVLNGVCKENYRITATSTGFQIELYCDDQHLATSSKTDYTSDSTGGDADLAIDEMVTLMEREFYQNHQSNRKNLSMPLLNYFDYTVTPGMVDGVAVNTIDYTLYHTAFDFVPANAIMSGSITRADTEENTLTALLCELAMTAGKRKNYIFQPNFPPYASPYQFILCDRWGEVVGTSIAADFNDALATEINGLILPKVTVSGSTALDGTYNLVSAVAAGPQVTVNIVETLVTTVFDGQLSFTETFNIVAVDTEERMIEIDADVSAHLSIGDEVEINAPLANEGKYTIRGMGLNGGNSQLYVQQVIPDDDDSGSLSYTKSFEIIGVSANSLTISGGKDEAAVAAMIDFVTAKFLNKEGMHIIEHTLLRPRINGDYFVDSDATTLSGALANNGYLFFKNTVAIFSVDAASNSLLVPGNLVGKIESATIVISGGSLNDGTYTIKGITKVGSRTRIEVEEDLLFTLPDPPYKKGNMTYVVKTDIKNAISATQKIRVGATKTVGISIGDVVQIMDSENERNDARYIVTEISLSGIYRFLTLGKVEQLIQDKLLPVHLDQDCQSCQQTDPYSCVLTVVLPYWAGRFTNLDLRKFIEKTIRTETPAHLLLNICWIDCEQMEALETKYKAWLTEVAKKTWTEAELSAALGELIDMLSDLRNVYPVGTLHDCAEDDGNLEGAIVLNNSLLGTF